MTCITTGWKPVPQSADGTRYHSRRMIRRIAWPESSITMTDESPDMRSKPEPGVPGSGESIGDETVVELLDRASALATEMATELGEASPEQRATQSEDSLTDLKDLAESLDKELDQMDKLTKEVGDQVGVDEADDSVAIDAAMPQTAGSDAATSPAGEAEQALGEAAAALDQSLSEEIDSLADPAASIGNDGTADTSTSQALGDTAAAEGAETEVPDFGSDLLEPEGPKTPDAAGGAMGEGAESFDDDLTAPPVEENKPAPAVVQEAKGPPAPDTPTESAAPAEQGKSTSTPALVSILTRAPANALCTLLDLADRPFSRVPPGVRSLIGVAALATLATSVAILAISML